MTRKEFIKMCGILGLAFPLQTSFSSCTKKDNEVVPSNDVNKVIIIGAGAAGLTTAYLLKQQNIEVQVLEASASYGGRMKRTLDFADFPIPLGAEWLHVAPSVFKEIINDESINIDVNTTPYNPDVDYGLYEGDEVSLADIGFTIDQKFINTSWFDFFDQYIVPSVSDALSFNKVVETIDYTGDQVLVKTQQEEFTADRVIVTAPVKILQNGVINFIPALPSDKLEALSQVKVWDGCKAFIRFSEKFYPAFVAFDVSPASAGQKLYYDAAYGQDTDQHILGLFAVGTGTLPYVQLSDSELIAYMLNELDQIFDGKASANYEAHIFQNWNAEPHIKGAYLNDQEDWRLVRTLGKSVKNKLFFAGTSYTTGNDWGSVHSAARSARRAVAELLHS